MRRYSPCRYNQSRGYNNLTAWQLSLDLIDYNGKVFGFRNYQTDIQKYEGCLPLTSLVAYPLNLHPKQSRIREALREREKVCFPLWHALPILQWPSKVFWGDWWS